MSRTDIIAEAHNPEGHLVQLDQTAWDHVLEQHVEMRDYIAETMAAITTPDKREPDVRVGRERYFRRGGPLRWIRVVTQLSGSVDRVVTAFPQSNDPGSVSWRR
jgi:hypothetical protein